MQLLKLRTGTVEKHAIHDTSVLNQCLPGSLLTDYLADPRVLTVGSFLKIHSCVDSKLTLELLKILQAAKTVN